MLNEAEQGLVARLSQTTATSPTSDLIGDLREIAADQVAVALVVEAEQQTRNDPVKALLLAQRASDMAALAPQAGPALAARCARATGHAHRALGQHTQSLDFYDQATAGYRLARLPVDAARTALGKIDALTNLGRTQDALALGRVARRTFVRHREWVNLARLEANLSIVYARLRCPRRALALATAAARRFEEAGEEMMLAQLQVNRANLLVDLGEFRAALEAYTTARAPFAAGQVRSWTAKIDVNIGYLYAAQGRYNRALHTISAACSVFTELNSPRDLALANLDLADVYLALNLCTDAYRLAETAATTLAAQAMNNDLGRAFLIAGQARHRSDDSTAQTSVRSLLDQAVSAFTASGNEVGVAIVHLHRASVMQDDPAIALASAIPALAVVKRRGLVAYWVEGLLLVANLCVKSGDVGTARRIFQQARRAGDRYDLAWAIAQAWHGEGRLLEQRDVAAAQRAYQAAITAIEEMRADLQPEEARMSFVHSRLAPYQDLLRLVLQSNKDQRWAEAFSLVERARSRALLDMVAGNLDVGEQHLSASTDPATPDSAMHRRIAQLREELNWQLSISHDWSDAAGERRSVVARREARRAAHDVEVELHTLLRQVSLAHSPQAMVHTADTADLSTIQASLRSDEALIEYAYVGTELLVFVIDHQHVCLLRHLTDVQTIDTLVERLHAGLQRFGFGDTWSTRHKEQLARTTDHHLMQLATLLIDLLVADLPRYRSLIVVPCGSLHYVPFHALPLAGGRLLDAYETIIVPSASVWEMCRRRARITPRQPGGTALIIGVEDAQTPWMVREAEEIGTLVSQPRVCVGQAATLSVLRAEAGNCDMIHLACHGMFRHDSPFFSALKLADGWLTVHDIYALRLQARLVTLSGCQTGQQAIGPGDDLVGLARGFFSAGATLLVVSLWTINDANTQEAMQAFYTALRAGETVPMALQTMHHFGRDRGWHPYYWAPFIVMGAEP